MPSVVKVEKQETVAVLESSEPTKQMLHLVENKIRNLEKRKLRLDVVRDKKQSGEELNSEQKEALAKYELVLQSIDFVKELQKSLQQQFAESEKLTKKQQKKERSEKQAVEQRRLRDLLFTQALLSGLTDDSVRNDFKHGTNGAVFLTSEELAQLDELRSLIGTTREATTKFSAQLSVAAEHVMCLLDGRDKAVAKTTYQALQAVIKKVEDCGYFDKPKTAPITSSTVSEAAPVAVVATESVIVASVVTVPQSAVASENAAPVMVTMYNGSHAATFTSAAYLSTPADSRYVHHERPIQDIVTSGPFNFLQESEIETAVATGAEGAVAYLPQSIYNSTVLVSQPQAVYADPSHMDKSYLPATVYLPAPMGVPSAPGAVLLPSLSSAHYQAVAAGGAMFTIPHMTTANIEGVPVSAVQPITAEILEAQYAVANTYNGHHESTELSQEKKPFTMNPEADEFQSMYTTAGVTFGTESQVYVNSNLSAASVEPCVAGEEVLQVQIDTEQEWHQAGGYQRIGAGQRGGSRGFRGGFGRGNRRGNGGFRGRGFYPGRGGRGGYNYGPRSDWQQNGDYDNRPSNGHHRGRGRGFYRNGVDNKETTAPATDSSHAPAASSQ